MSSKQHAVGIKDRSSQADRVSVLKRFGHLASLVNPGASNFHDQRAAVWTFLTSDDFVTALVRMTRYDRIVTMITVADSTRPFADSALIPAQAESHLTRAKWTEEAVVKLHEIAAQHGMRPGLDREIARQMRLPLRAVTMARFRFLGRVRRAHVSHKRRNRGLAGEGARAEAVRSTAAPDAP